MLKQPIYFVVFVLGLSLITPLARATYVPPPEQERVSDYSKSTGVRNGFEEGLATIPLILLAPQTHVGQASSITPAFTWMLDKHLSGRMIDFRLFEFDHNSNLKQRGDALKLNAVGGVVQLPFPQKSVTLGHW